MLSRVFNFVKTIFGSTHNNGETEHEHFIISRKRPADATAIDSSPAKRIRLEGGVPFVSGLVEKEGHPLRVLMQDSAFFTKPTMRQSSISKKPQAASTYRSTDFMDIKGPREGFPSLRSLSHCKENVIELSDNEDDEVSHQHVHTGARLSSRRGSDSYWVDAVPKLSSTTISFQPSSYMMNDKSAKDDNLPSKRPDLAGGPTYWQIPAASSTASRLPNRLGRGRLALRPKRLDTKHYTPVTLASSSSLLGIQETIRLNEKSNYSKLLRHYEAEKSKQPTSAPHSSHLGKFVGVFNSPHTPLVSFTKSRGKIEVIDLTTKNKEPMPKVRRDQEVKPETLASKMASGSVGVPKPVTKPAVTRINSFEDFLKNNKYYKPMFLEDTVKKFEEKKRQSEKELQEPRLRAELYARKNERDMKEIEERLLRHIKITEAEVVLEDISEEELVLPALTPRMQKVVDSALLPHPHHETLVEAFSLKITRRDMHTLAGLNWLNDEVINFYMNLLIERGKLEKHPNVYAFNTFFYSKLISSGYITLKRWTRKIDIFSHDIIIVPVHLGVHWCMAAIDFRDKTVKYYDSMGNSNNKCLQALVKYLEDESMDKKKVPYDTSDWKKINVKDNPQQMNGSDCGVFACMYAEFIARNAKIIFTQANMPYFRRKMVLEIISAKLLQCP